jgi:hypothetical protein
MLSIRSALLLALCASIACGSAALGADISIKPGDQVIRVQVKSPEQLKALLALNIDVLSHEYGVGPIDVHASVEQRAAITKLALPFEVLNPDMMGTYVNERAENMLRAGLGNPFDSYLDINNTYAFMDNLVSSHPDLIEEIAPIGTTIEGRPIRVWRITGPDKSPKPGVFYHGLQHCREWITGPIILYIANQLVTTYDSNPAIQNLVNGVDFYLMPVANPDGYAYTWIDATTRLWRKNRRNNGDGSFGVDLNRNWAHGWGGEGASDFPDYDTYRGTGPFSEPETQAFSNFITTHPKIRGYLDYHSYGQFVMWAYGEDFITLPEPDFSRFYEIGQMYHRKAKEVTGQFYYPGPISQTLYQASGTSVDWTYGTAGRTAMTVEVRDTGAWEFELPPAQILPTCQENFAGAIYLAEWSTAGVVIVVKDPPPVVQSGSTTPVKFRVYTSAESYINGSATLRYRIGTSGPYSSMAATPLGGANFSATLPAAPCGSTVEYYMEAQGSGGFIAHAPNAFPVSFPESTTYTALSVQTLAIEDHFESNLGWTATVAGATAGQWQRGVPVNEYGYLYDPISDSDTSGQCYLTQNIPGLSSDVDNGTVILTSPTMDLSGGDVRITYDYFLSLDAANGADKLLVEMDSNNGAGPWKQIALHNTDGGVSWHRDSINQTALNAAGVTLSSTMKIRFSVNDGTPQSNVEGGIDNVRISVGTCVSIPCPGIPGDMNNSGIVDADDVQGFVNANIISPFYNPCADLALPSGVLDAADTAAFVTLLLQ